MDSSKPLGTSTVILNFKWLFLKLMSRSHQTLCRVPTVKLLEIMFRNRCWPTTFHTIAVGDSDK